MIKVRIREEGTDDCGMLGTFGHDQLDELVGVIDGFEAHNNTGMANETVLRISDTHFVIDGAKAYFEIVVAT